MQVTADPGSEAAIRQRLLLVDEGIRKEQQLYDLVQRRAALPGGGAMLPGAPAPAQFDQAFDRQLDRSLQRFRPRAAEGLRGTRGVGGELRAAEELLMGGRPSFRHAAHLGTSLARELGLGRVAGAMEFAAGAAGPLMMAGAAGVGIREMFFGMLEKALARQSVETDWQAREAMEKTFSDKFEQTEALRNRQTGEISAMLERGLRQGEFPTHRSIRDLYPELLGGDRGLPPEGVEAQALGEARLRREFAQNLEEVAKAGREGAEHLQRQLGHGIPTAGGDWQGQFSRIPQIITEQVKELLERGADAQNLSRALRAAADELRAATRASAEAREMKARAGEQETGGVRNAVLWAQDRARMKAVEQGQLEKYMSWSTY